MNYYNHHIGDYRADTAHLSLLEHGIYRQLLDQYYLSEKPIPKETELVFRRLRAITEDEQNAVIQILQEFFTWTEQGYVHARCEEELAGYRLKAEKARENGKHGGRPPKKTEQKPTQNPEITKPVSLANPEITGSEANQEPKTKNHKPKEEKTLSGKPDASRDEALGILDYLNLKAGREFRPVEANVNIIVARMREGATMADCKQVIDRKVAEWKGGEFEQYLAPDTLFRASKFAKYIGQLAAPLPAKSKPGQQQEFSTVEYGPSGDLP